jgi:hypothetical protein
MAQKEKIVFTPVHGVLITIAVQTFIYLASVAVAVVLYVRYDTGLFAAALVFYGAVVCLTLLVLKLFRVLSPLKPGVYGLKDAWVRYLLSLQWLLCTLNLYWMYKLVPPVYKKFYYRLLGAKMGKGVIPILGELSIPELITVDQGAFIANAAIEGVAFMPEKKILLGPVHVKKAAIVGGQVSLGPFTTVGENSIVSQASLVPMFISIPDNEIWAGNPAKKVGDNPKSQET